MKIKFHLINGETITAETDCDTFEKFCKLFREQLNKQSSEKPITVVADNNLINWNCIVYIEEYKESEDNSR